MSRAVIYQTFGGPEVLELREVSEPHAGPGEVRVRVTAAGLTRWTGASPRGRSWRRGSASPCRPASGPTSPASSTRSATARPASPWATASTGPRWDEPWPTSWWSGPLPIRCGIRRRASATRWRALSGWPAPLPPLPWRIGLHSGDTVLIGGPAGGVGVFATQLAVLAGATVIGTASPGTLEFLRQLGAEPVAYGPGLADWVRALAPGGVTAATDLFGTETAEAALALGVPPERISTIAVGPNPPGGVRATGGFDAAPDVLGQVTDAILAGQLTVPVAAAFPVEKIRDAVTMQAGRHVHGKVVVTL